MGVAPKRLLPVMEALVPSISALEKQGQVLPVVKYFELNFLS